LLFHTLAYAAFLSDPLSWTLLAAGATLARRRPELQPATVDHQPSTRGEAAPGPAPA